LKENEYRVDIKHLNTNKVLFQLPDRVIINEIALGWGSESIKINVLFETKQILLEADEPPIT
jgi:hypothetical protein